MACNCTAPTPPQNSKFRKALIIALLLNLSLFIIEVFGGYLAHSAALWADALDFFGDSVNYFISLTVLSMGLYWRSTVTLLKGIVMCLFGIFVLAKVLYAYQTGTVPEPIAMGAIAILALIANLVCAFILYAFRDGDSNMQSVWLCSRNDAIGNIAVVFAALGVFGTGSLWPDLVVALIMAFLGVSAGYRVVKLAYAERQLAKRKFCNSTQG